MSDLRSIIANVRALDAAHELAVRATPYDDTAEKLAWREKQVARHHLNDAIYALAGVNIDELKGLTRT